MKHVFACLTASTLLCASPAVAAQDSRAVLQAATADAIRDHCLARAAGAGVPVAVAVFDHGGDLVSFGRHDGTTPATGAVAQWKGRSAAVYLNPTAVTGTWNVPTAPMIATAEGGVPLFTTDGTGIGGDGVSGAPPELDADCATLAAEAAGLAVAPP